MTSSVITDVSDLLKKDIEPAIQREVFQNHILLDKIRKNSGIRKLGNNSFYITAQVSQHSGVYFVSPSGDLMGGAPTYHQMQVDAMYGYGSHQITDAALEACQGDPGALADLLTEFGETVKQALSMDLNRQFHGDATGQLCLVNGASSGTTITCDTPGTQYIYEGMQLSIGTAAEHAAGTADDCTVSAVTADTTFTIASAITVADDDIIKKKGAHSYEMNGFKNLIAASGTVQGIDLATHRWAQAYIDSTAEVLSEADMVTALLNANKYGKVEYILTNQTLYEKYASLLTSMKRAVNTLDLGGGFAGLEFAAGGQKCAVVLDYDTPAGVVEMWSPKAWTIAQLAMGWLDRGEGILKPVSGKPAYWASYKFYGNLACKSFRSNAKLSGKTA